MDNLIRLINNGKVVQFNRLNKSKNKDYKQLGKSTINAYITNLNKLHRELKIDIKIDNLDWLLDMDKIKDFVNKLQSANTRKNYLTAIISVLHSNYDEYTNAIEFYIKLSSNNVVDIKLDLKTDKACNDNKIISMTEYNMLLNKLQKNIKYRVEYVILSMLKYYPIRNEIYNLKYIKYSDYKILDKDDRLNHNWLIDKTNKLTMIRNIYKTSDIFGSISTDINNEIKKIIKKYINDFGVNSGDLLFNFKPSTLQLKIADITHTITGIRLGTSSIFKIVCCDVLQKYKDDTRIDMLRYYGAIRGTSLKILIDYYIYGNTNELND